MCRHIRKGLEQGNLKKALVNVEWNICQDCKTDNKVKDKAEEETEEKPSVWLCLKCGHQVCLLLRLIWDFRKLFELTSEGITWKYSMGKRVLVT